MDGTVVQLVQGREKALEGDSPEEMLDEVRRLSDDPGDRSRCRDRARARMKTSWSGSRARAHADRRRSPHGRESAPSSRSRCGASDRRHCGFRRERAERSVPGRARRECLARGDPARARFEGRPHRRQRLARIAGAFSREIIRELEPYCGGFLCTYVDKEGMMQGTDLDGSAACARRPRTRSPPPVASLPTKTSPPCRRWGFMRRSAWRFTRDDWTFRGSPQ